MTNSVLAHGDDQRQFQIFVRSGMIEGSYAGVFSGSFRVNLAFDIGTEYHVASDGSVLVRFIQALDSPDSVPFYTYAGTGMRYYFKGRGSYVVQSDETTFISSRPKWRTYMGGELGIAQVIVKSFGPVIQSVANMLETGGNVGAIYQISEKIGIEAQIGGTLGYGISSTSVSGSTFRIFLGGTYFF
jgi:hypothetical protein